MDNQDTEGMDITNELDLIEIYRSFHPTTAAYIFFSSENGQGRTHSEPKTKPYEV